MALAGADGKRAADLLRRSKREGAAVLSNLARVAVTRLLERGSNALTAKRLFTDGERRVLADSVAATNATANLLGRARVRERMHLAQRRHEPEKLAELPPHVELFEEPKARDLKPLPPEKAVQYFRKLTPTVGIKDPPRFGQLMQRQAFTLAVDADDVLLGKVKEAIQRRLETGEAVRAAPAEIEALLEAAGVAPKNPAYAEQVFRTNMMDSYTQGTQEELRDPDVADVFPVWKYLIVRDHRTRPHHAIHADQYFPNQVLFTEVRDSVKGGFDGYNCRCAQQPVSKWEWAELQRGGVAVSTFAERRPTQPFTVAVDLDGTLAEYDGWKGEDHFGALRPGAREALADLRRRSCRLIIFTTRGNTEKVRAWLEANRVPFDFINENPDQPPGSSGKVIADLYLDDRAVNAAGAWPAIHAAAVRRLELGTFAERPVPDLRQTTNYDCGAGALAAALAAFGLPVDVVALREELGSNPSDGTRVNQLTEIAQQRGLGVAEYWGMDRGAMGHALAGGALVLCPVQMHVAGDMTSDRNGHYVLVTGLEGDQVVFHDPMRGDDGGRQTLPWADWLRGWHDYDTGGRYYHRCGLILTPPAERFCGGPGSGTPGPCPENKPATAGPVSASEMRDAVRAGPEGVKQLAGRIATMKREDALAAYKATGLPGNPVTKNEVIDRLEKAKQADLPAAPSTPATSSPSAKLPAEPPASPGARAKLDPSLSPPAREQVKRLAGDLAKTPGLSDTQRVAYFEATQTTIKNMTPQALERFSAGLTDGAKFYGDHEAIRQGLKEQHADNPAVLAKLDAAGTTGGCYSKKGDTTSLHLDGGYTDKVDPSSHKMQSATDIYAHEFAHSIDGPKSEISGSKEWRTAFEAELSKGRLTGYAATHPAEGFAEFGRLVLSGRHDTAKVREAFPRCWAVWESRGLVAVPGKTAVHAEPAADGQFLPDIFGQRIELDGRGHLDMLREEEEAEVFCGGPGSGVPGPCPTKDRGVAGRALDKAISVEHKVKAVVGKGFDKLPEPVQKVVTATLKVAFAPFTAGQGLAERVARERGLSAEQAAQLRGQLATADLLAFKAAKGGAFAGIPGAGTATMVSGVVPVASTGYLAYSTAKDPAATYRAAKGAVKDAVAAARARLSGPKVAGSRPTFKPSLEPLGRHAEGEHEASVATEQDANRLADALAAHDFDDWYAALLAAALEELNGDVESAIAAAEQAYQARPASGEED